MPGQEKGTLSRRAFVGRVATVTAGAAVALTATTAGRSNAATRQASVDAGAPQTEALDSIARPEAPQVVQAPPVTESAPPPWEVLAPLTAGAALNTEWKLSGLTAIEAGSSVLTLSNQHGREHRVHICRNDGVPQGLVYTDKFDLVVMNGGRGDLPTEENFGRAVAAVAHAIAANERSQRHAPTLARLLPQSERVERFATTAQLR